MKIVNAVLSFFLAVIVYPEVQARAQGEIDRVIGPDRLPTLDDREDLPYLNSVVWECLRWNPGKCIAVCHRTIAELLVVNFAVTPLGLARNVTEDDEYKGYRIPKGTTVLPNVW